LWKNPFKTSKEEVDKEIERRKTIEESLKKEPGVCREYVGGKRISFARVREAHTGREVWRARVVTDSEYELPADACDTIEEFIDIYIRGKV